MLDISEGKVPQPHATSRYKIRAKRSVNARIARATIGSRVDLIKVENETIDKIKRVLVPVIAFIRLALKDLHNPHLQEAAKLRGQENIFEAVPSIQPVDSDAAYRVAQRLIAQIEPTLRGSITQIRNTLEQVLVQVATREGRAVADILKAELPKRVYDKLQGGLGISSGQDTNTLKTLIDTPLGGSTYAKSLENTYGRSLERVRGSIAQGLIGGEDYDTIADRVDGVLSRDLASNAYTLARTEIQRVANLVNLDLFQRNDDIIDGVQWLATLDASTCIECGAMDGETFDSDGPDDPPPLHPNCRCILIPLVKNWEDLGIDAEDLPDNDRASMDGSVPGRISFSDWIGDQSEDVQRDVLGPTRFKLLDSGKATLEDFVDADGSIIPISRLAKQFDIAEGISTLGITNTKLGSIGQAIVRGLGKLKLPGMKNPAKVYDLTANGAYHNPFDLRIGKYAVEVKTFTMKTAKLETRLHQYQKRRKLGWLKSNKGLIASTMIVLWDSKLGCAKVYWRKGIGNFPIKSFGEPIVIDAKIFA